MILVSALVVASCSTLPGPSQTVRTLVVGEVAVQATNFASNVGGGININGTRTDGVTLTLTNYQSKAVTVLKADKAGFFCSAALPAGNYVISKILVDFSAVNGTAGETSTNTFTIYTDPSASTKFVVPEGKVTNLGKIVWYAIGDGDSRVMPEEQYDGVKTRFIALYQTSKWLAQDWVSFSVTSHIDFDFAVSSVHETPKSAPADFRNAPLDKKVRQIPPSVFGGQSSNPDGALSALVTFLSQGSPNDFVTVKRLHDWVADNIAYDTPSFLSGKIPDQSYKAVLATRLAVCEGYATLFKKMCDIKGISCALVSGYSRGYGSSVFSTENVTSSNHAWNIVKINGSDYLVDTTWDAGYLENDRFIRSYSAGYLFADPEAFIHSHFPENPQYQLLKNPVDAQEFSHLSNLNCYFYSSGIVPLSRLDNINSLGNEFSLQFKIPDDIDIMAAVYDADGGKEVRGAAFRQHIGEVVTLNVALPKPGRYLLRIFKHGEEDLGSDFTGCGEIGLIADKESQARFPVTYSSFIKGDELISPVGRPLIPGKVTPFRIKLPKGSIPYLIVNGKLVPMNSEGNDGQFGLSLLIPTGIDRVTLAVATTANGSAESLLDFPVQTRN
jgi:transglutaminase-like putative cysteine protease